jgi:hypothetical protein
MGLLKEMDECCRKYLENLESQNWKEKVRDRDK